MSRITRQELYIASAALMSLRGTCERLNVGCVVVKDHRIISSGYNGVVKDAPRCSDLNCLLGEACKRAIHAEANAIYFAAKKGISLEGATIYCTHSPCRKCAEAIIQSGITEVIFDQDYRDQEPKQLMLRAGLEVKHYEGTDIQDIIKL
jgi:dCMP deaminase